jgi:hypothetical protein
MSDESNEVLEQAPVRGSSAFVAQVARYYRDFLETDFRKSRAPARQVRIRDESGNPLGFNVRRYPQLLTALSKELAEPFQSEVVLSVRRGQYTQKVSENVQRLLSAQITALDDDELREVVNECVYKLRKRAPGATENFDEFVDDAQELIAERVMRTVVGPLVKTLEGVLAKTRSINAEDLLYEIEDDIAEHIVDAIRENLPEALVRLAQAGDLVPLVTLLNETIGPDVLREFLIEFFSNLATSDAYEELLGLANTIKLNESLEVYLYLMDLIVKPHQFPIAYIPLRLEKAGDRFMLHFDNRLFFNRRALRYVVDSNRDSDLRVPGPPTNDRIHFLFEASPLAFLEETVLALTDAYKLPDRLKPLGTELHRNRTPLLAVTNAIHICAFQKGEEAIVNDYEEILVQSKESDSPLRTLFDNLINGCILDEPKSIRGNVESSWEDTPRDERLVYESPVPLNEEQRKLLLALQSDSCRYAVVEGPPGTGKSHTITAIVFDAIMRDRSVLVLSDKNEALDVVEDKLTQTLNEIRPGDDFQNPILRLGRTSGTYNKILRKATRERIQHYFTAAKKHRARAQDKIEKKTKQVKEDINQTVEQLASIDIHTIMRYERLLSDLHVPNAESLGITSEIRGLLHRLIHSLTALTEEQRGELLELNSLAVKHDGDFRSLLMLRLLGAKATETWGKKLELLQQFEKIQVENITWLKSVIDELIAMRNPLFGYLFKKAECQALADQLADKMPLTGLQPPHKRRKTLKAAADLLIDIRDQSEKLNTSGVAVLLERLRRGPVRTALEADHLDMVRDLASFESKAARLLDAVWRERPSMQDWLTFNTSLQDTVNKVARIVELYLDLSQRFGEVPNLDLQKTQTNLQHEHTADLAHRLDKNVLDFINEAGALATTLKQLIQHRQPFPKDRFQQLKKAFPCIIAGIREFADYIPLEPGLVDIVIIDEASQVSIAQAFPALLRAKQVVVLGDEQQFANVKTSTASRAVNQSYMYDLEQVFRDNFNIDNERLERMRSFDVRTSILRFFDLVKHFDVMLKKHFRGYSELISFSSKYFYKGGLQAIRIRARPVTEVLVFTVLGDDELPPITHRNANEGEATFIHKELEALLEMEDPPSVGVITPFREQQKLATRMLFFDSPYGDDFRERLNLKVMTFDTCQGEERDVIYYSMASTRDHDRLNYIFPTALEQYDDGTDRIKAQRLNVGFSRAKETIHFVLSKPLEEYKGTVREVLRHYEKELANSKALPSVDEVDANSPMEAQVLHWLRNSPFYGEHADRLEVVPQFPIGDYLKQLDPFYEHPSYRVDFLLLYAHPSGRKIPIIIEYDGFREHFQTGVYIDESNYEYYYREEDVERQFVLESYGYNFLRINRFNLGEDPVETLSKRLYGLVASRVDESVGSEHTEAVKKMVEALETGDAKVCKKCGQAKALTQFRRPELKSGYGRYCNACNKRQY